MEPDTHTDLMVRLALYTIGRQLYNWGPKKGLHWLILGYHGVPFLAFANISLKSISVSSILMLASSIDAMLSGKIMLVLYRYPIGIGSCHFFDCQISHAQDYISQQYFTLWYLSSLKSKLSLDKLYIIASLNFVLPLVLQAHTQKYCGNIQQY